jgi:hypothetical protein
MRIDSSGNVGIGTASPAYKFDAYSAAGNLDARFYGGNASRVFITGSSYTWAIGVNYYLGAAFVIANTAGGSTLNDFVIDASGNTKFNSGYGSAATAYGCRAWVNFNGNPTAAIRSSGNVTSITRNAAGDYTVNFTTAMVDGNYAAVAATEADSSGDSRYFTTIKYNSRSTTSVGVYVSVLSVHYDVAYVGVAVFR